MGNNLRAGPPMQVGSREGSSVFVVLKTETVNSTEIQVPRTYSIMTRLLTQEQTSLSIQIG